MPDQNTVLYQLLKHVPHARFEELVKAHGSDDAARGLDSKSQLVALLYGQLSGAPGLRAIVAELESHEARLSELGCDPVRRSTLGDANRHRRAVRRSAGGGSGASPSRPAPAHGRGHIPDRFDQRPSQRAERAVGALFGHGVRRQGPHRLRSGRRPADPRRGDAGPRHRPHGRQGDAHRGRRHLRLRPRLLRLWLVGGTARGGLPDRHAVQDQHPLDGGGGAPPTPGDGGVILSDRVGRLPERQAGRRRNPFQAPVREVTVRIETGTVLRILSNDLKATAQDIADLYKRRWAIELFFRWVKQTLKIRHFVGTSENAVRIQIAVALIAFVLLRLAQATQDAIKSPLTFARLVRTNLMHRRRIDQLLRLETRPKKRQAMKKRRAIGLQEAPA